MNYGGRVNDQGTPEADDDTPVLATAEFNLETLAGKAAGAKTTVNGPRWVDSVKATLQAQRDQIATLQALGTRTASTRAAEAAAWQIVQDTVQYQLFGGTQSYNYDGDATDGTNGIDTDETNVPQLPIQLVGDYATNTDLQQDAVGLIDRVLDALTNTTTLFAALDPDGNGIFNHFDYDSTTDGVQEGYYIRYDDTPDQRRWETIGNNRPLSAFLGEREYKVIASVGTTDYTRFGAWYHIGAASAERQPNPAVRKNQGGPGAFAYSPLDPTLAGSQLNPAFPPGGTASFVGETVAIMDEDTLTGTVRVDVTWAARADTGGLDLEVNVPGADLASNAGSMSVTLGDLADSTGDPLTYTGTIGTATTPAQGYEIAEIVFDGMLIEVGLPGEHSGRLIVGAEDEIEVDGTGNGMYTYSELGLTAAEQVRYRLREIGLNDQPGSAGSTASISALFRRPGRGRSAGRARHVHAERRERGSRERHRTRLG